MKKHFSKQIEHILKHKTRLIILLAVTLVVIFGVTSYLFALKIDKDAQNSLVASSDKVAGLTSKFNQRLADKAISGSDKIALVKNYSSDAKDVANQLCGSQKGHIYSFLVSTLDRCERAKTKLEAITGTTDTIYRYLESDAALAALIPTKLDDLTFSQSYEAWNSTLGAIDAMNVPNELKGQKTALVKAITDYRDAWKALVDADLAHDEVAFVAAQDLLIKNHQALFDSVQNTANPLKEMLARLATQLSGYFEESKAP